MKAYLILCVLFASIFFFPSSLLGRELGDGTATPPAENPTKPPALPCSPRGPGKPYNCNAQPPKSGYPCKKYQRNCPPTGIVSPPPTGNPNKPAQPCPGGKGNKRYNCNARPPKSAPPCNSPYRRNCPPNSSP